MSASALSFHDFTCTCVEINNKHMYVPIVTVFVYTQYMVCSMERSHIEQISNNVEFEMFAPPTITLIYKHCCHSSGIINTTLCNSGGAFMLGHNNNYPIN